MADTPSNSIPMVDENVVDISAATNDALLIIDLLLQILVVSVGLNAPPGSPVNGARYVVGASPTGPWSGHANQVARWIATPGYWQFASARYVLNAADGNMWVRPAATWSALAGGSGGEVNTASNLGAGAGLFASKSGVDLQFKSLVAGVNITLTSDGTTVTIAAAQPSVVTESTTARNLALADAGKYIRHTNASASTVTVVPQASAAWVADTEITLRRSAAGNLTLTPGVGVTLNAPSGGTLVMTNNMTVTLKRVASDVWDVIGQTVPV